MLFSFLNLFVDSKCKFYCFSTQNRSSNSSRVSSAAINRRKQQEKIDYNNGILKKKIERIANRTSK